MADTTTAWLYDLLKVIDDVANTAQVLDDVPNIQEWVEGIRREERERCTSRSLTAVNAILEDLTDRRGLCQEWEQIEPAIQVEIINTWKDAITTAIQEAT